MDILPSKVVGVYFQAEALLRSISEILDIVGQYLDARSLLCNYQTDRTDNLPFYFYHLWKNYNKNQNNTKKIS